MTQSVERLGIYTGARVLIAAMHNRVNQQQRSRLGAPILGPGYTGPRGAACKHGGLYNTGSTGMAARGWSTRLMPLSAMSGASQGWVRSYVSARHDESVSELHKLHPRCSHCARQAQV